MAKGRRCDFHGHRRGRFRIVLKPPPSLYACEACACRYAARGFRVVPDPRVKQPSLFAA